MRKAILLVLVFLSLLILIVKFSYGPLAVIFGIKDRAGVRVESTSIAQVSIDKVLLGKTPFQKEDLSPGEHLLELSSDKGSWQGLVKLNSGTLTVVNRELAPTQASSSGEIITLEPGSGATLLSNPAGSDVEIDGKSAGKTPLSVSNLAVGEHLFTLSHPNYLKRSIRAAVAQNYDLTLSVDLAISEADLTQIAVPVIEKTTSVKVLSTPTGFLTVRDQPSTSGNKIDQVSPGDTLILLDELPSWDKVKLSNGKEGYVFSSYVQKITP